MSIHALILAGGTGSRLGAVSKESLRIGGVSLLDRVAGQLRDIETPLLLSGPQPAMPGMVNLPDMDLPVGGPLAGLIAAASHLEGMPADDVLLTVAVDTPFLPNDFVRRLVAGLTGNAGAAVAGWRGNFYPTNAIWRLAVLADLPSRARAGTLPNSPKSLLLEANAARIDWAGSHAQDPFANLNTLEDLMALTRRAHSLGL